MTDATRTDAIRWGILATGGIAHAFANDLVLNGFHVQAVGSRSQASADAFAAEFDIPTAHASYEALAAVTVLTVWLRHGELARAFPAAVGLTGVAAVGLLALGLATVIAPDVLGLAERICLAGILGWTFTVCAVLRSRRRGRRMPRAGSQGELTGSRRARPPGSPTH